jgi:transcriptional regulator PpsR
VEKRVSTTPKDLAAAPDMGMLSEFAPQLAETFVSIASDIALVIDEHGVIRNVAVGDDPLTDRAHDWVGRAWRDTVTGETRRKVEMLLAEARAGRVTQRREVNHRNEQGHDIPVAYAAVRLGHNGPVLAVGRDLRAVAAIQQRFVEAQQGMERDYWRQRQTEARYRMLFHVATDGVLVVDAQSLAVVEANGAAARLFGRVPETLPGLAATTLVADAARAAVEELFVTTRTTGRPGEIRAAVQAAAGAPGLPPLPVDVSATPFAVDGKLLLLVRARASQPLGGQPADHQRLADYVERSPDAVVITDSQGRVLMANGAFEQLHVAATRARAAGVAGVAGVADPGSTRGRDLAELLGDPHLRLPGLLHEARYRGIAERRLCTVGRADVAMIDVEVSAALLAEGDQECLGLTLRRVDQRLAGLPPQVGELASAIDRLAVQVGVVPLTDLVRETSELAERHLIQAAMARADGNLLQVAALLGLTPEALWLRLRHHGIDAGAGGPAPSSLLN